MEDPILSSQIKHHIYCNTWFYWIYFVFLDEGKTDFQKVPEFCCPSYSQHKELFLTPYFFLSTFSYPLLVSISFVPLSLTYLFLTWYCEPPYFSYPFPEKQISGSMCPLLNCHALAFSPTSFYTFSSLAFVNVAWKWYFQTTGNRKHSCCNHHGQSKGWAWFSFLLFLLKQTIHGNFT